MLARPLAQVGRVLFRVTNKYPLYLSRTQGAEAIGKIDVEQPVFSRALPAARRATVEWSNIGVHRSYNENKIY